MCGVLLRGNIVRTKHCLVKILEYIGFCVYMMGPEYYGSVIVVVCGVFSGSVIVVVVCGVFSGVYAEYSAACGIF